ncbi:MAG: cobalamin-dependent protein [Rhodobacteraceae bacterium]|jgi:methylmalonyl-CoA mutase cobalamin-binding subunit|nr:cobalamin-dependent protein [Paracoccaceae bacterium]
MASWIPSPAVEPVFRRKAEAPRPAASERREPSPLPAGAALDAEVVAAVRALAGEESRHQREAAVRRLLMRGVGLDSLIDAYVPAVARMLGEDWCCDRLGFVEVTVMTHRLQTMVRDLCHAVRADDAADADAPTALVVVLHGEQHSLGATVAASQLRRLGLSAQLSLGRPAVEVEAACRRSRFDLVAISVGGDAGLDSAAELITLLRTSARALPPLVIGGSLRVHEDDVRLRTGADHFCPDTAEAVRRCGLMARVQGAGCLRGRSGQGMTITLRRGLQR